MSDTIPLSNWKEPDLFQQAREAQSHFIFSLLAALEQAPHPEVALEQLEGLLDTSMWRMTVPIEKFKYDQRFISAGTKTLFENYNRCLENSEAWSFSGEPKKWIGRRHPMDCVQHDHVMRRATLIEELLKARSDGVTLKQILSRSQACVVTWDEHKAVGRFDKTERGWDRYKRAQVGVWDRVEGEWFIPASQKTG